MSDPDKPDGAGSTGARFGFRLRFSLHGAVLIASVGAALWVAQGAISAFVHAWWGPSYRVVTFVMDEWRPNDGSPYVTGRLEGSDGAAPFLLEGDVAGGRRVLRQARDVAFEPEAKVRVWYSPEAPLYAFMGERTNVALVSALPERPGWGRFVAHSLASLAILVAGLYATWRVYLRYTGQVGTLPSPRR